jgi:hypothetical protein
MSFISRSRGTRAPDEGADAWPEDTAGYVEGPAGVERYGGGPEGYIWRVVRLSPNSMDRHSSDRHSSCVGFKAHTT